MASMANNNSNNSYDKYRFNYSKDPYRYNNKGRYYSKNSTGIKYNKYGFDRDGFDINGLNKYGYDRDGFKMTYEYPPPSPMYPSTPSPNVPTSPPNQGTKSKIGIPFNDGSPPSVKRSRIYELLQDEIKFMTEHMCEVINSERQDALNNLDTRYDTYYKKLDKSQDLIETILNTIEYDYKNQEIPYSKLQQNKDYKKNEANLSLIYQKKETLRIEYSKSLQNLLSYYNDACRREIERQTREVNSKRQQMRNIQSSLTSNNIGELVPYPLQLDEEVPAPAPAPAPEQRFSTDTFASDFNITASKLFNMPNGGGIRLKTFKKTKKINYNKSKKTKKVKKSNSKLHKKTKITPKK